MSYDHYEFFSPNSRPVRAISSFPNDPDTIANIIDEYSFEHQVENPLYDEFSCDNEVSPVRARLKYAMEDVTFSEYCASSSQAICELEKQLSKFDGTSQVEEARTQSFLAKVNARITSHLPEKPAYSEFYESDSDGRFILLKNSSYYFPILEDEG